MTQPRLPSPEPAPAARLIARGAGRPARALQEIGRVPKRRLGQHFLTSASVAEQIVRAAELKLTDVVLEIGPGLGILTERLVAVAARVVAVEVDAELARMLPGRLGNPENLHVVHADALTVDLAELVQPPFVVVANLPYYVATPILFRLLFQPPQPTRIVVMLQLEVAMRVVGQRGRMTFLGAAVASVATARIVRRVAPGSFYPPPKVWSAVVRIDRREAPVVPENQVDAFLEFLRAGFAQPRKQLRNSLAQGLGISPHEAAELVSSASIDDTCRPAQLSLEEWVALFREFQRRSVVGAG